MGRGIFTRARHAAGQGAPAPSLAPGLSFPVVPPRALATPMTVRAFNAVYWRRLGRQRRRVGPYGPVLFPLDAVGGWNRVYGPDGFYQFQSVVPAAASRDATREMLRVIAASGQGSMLSVLKVCGDAVSPGMLSFPLAGASLALDFPNRGAPTLALLARLEAVAIAAGGRIYGAKDGAMSAGAFRAGYPALDAFIPHVDPAFSSALARRLLPA